MAIECKKWAKAPITLEMSMSLKDMEMRTDWLTGSSPSGNHCLCTQNTIQLIFSRPNRRCCSSSPSAHHEKKKTNKKHVIWMARDGCWLMVVFSVKVSQKEKRIPFDLFRLNKCLFDTEAISGALMSVAPPASSNDAFTLINQPSIDTNLPHPAEQRVTVFVTHIHTHSHTHPSAALLLSCKKVCPWCSVELSHNTSTSYSSQIPCNCCTGWKFFFCL